MSDTSFIKVTCTCGKTMKAPAAAMGKKAKCPGCGAIVLIGAGGSAAPVAPAAAPANACPNCASPMPQGAVLCINCGYDTRTGKKFTTEIG